MSVASPGKSEDPSAAYTFGPLRLESDGTLFRNGEAIHLPPKELAALRLLLQNAGRIVTPSQLKAALWGDISVTPDSLPRCMSSLRSRLEPNQCIQTVYKRGYRIVVAVHSHSAKAGNLVRLAVMPFGTGPFVAEYLGASIAEEVTARLTEADHPRIAVLARDSTFTLAHRGLTALQTGEALGADMVLTGTLNGMPSHFRLRAEMIRVRDGVQIWVEDFLVPADDLASLNAGLADRLIYRLGGDRSSTAAHGSASLAHPTNRNDAYESFLRGRFEWHSLDRQRMQDGTLHLMRATELDPTFISAQLDLANVCVTQELYGFITPSFAAEQVRRITQSVPDACDSIPALQPTLGWMLFHIDRNLAAAEEMFSLSAHLPHDPWITRLRVMFALSRRDFQEATDWLNAALLVDPYAPWLHSRLAWTFHLAGDGAASVQQIEKCLARFPEHESTHLYGAMILAHNGHTGRALELSHSLVRQFPFFDIGSAIHAYVLARAGKRKEAASALEMLDWLSRERFVLSSFNPAAYVALGETKSAIESLRVACEQRCPWYYPALADPRLAPLHSEPDFQQMLNARDALESNLPSYQLASDGDYSESFPK